MQLLAKFKKILYMEFRATLNFRKGEFHNSKEIHRRITPAATSNSFPKDNEKSQPQPQKKGKSSIIDSGDENQTLIHEINRFRSPELLVCLLCLNEFSSHDIVLHTK